MDPEHLLSPRQRIVRGLLGVGLIVLAVVIFAVSDALDPQNRAAVLSIIALIVGMSLTGQAIRGVHDGPMHRESPPPTGRPVSPALRVYGLVLAWLVPGLGHWLIGRRGKAALYFAVVTACFVTGVVLAHGTNLSWEKDRIFFFAYAWNGAQALLGSALLGAVERDHPVAYLQMGYLYCAVAGLLNLVAVMDFDSSAARGLPPAGPAPESSEPAAHDGAHDGTPDAQPVRETEPGHAGTESVLDEAGREGRTP